jgi:hypothetical protein
MVPGGILLAAGCGTGKTLTTLGAYARLKRDHPEARMLVIAPPPVCDVTWPTEIAQWLGDQVTVANLHAMTPAQRIKEALTGKSDISLVTYALLPSLIRSLIAAGDSPAMPWHIVVADEASVTKAGDSVTAQAVIALARRARRFWALSGTPMANTPSNLWAIMAGVTKGAEPWGDNYFRWRQRHYKQDPRIRWKWSLRPGAADAIKAAAEPHTLAISLRDVTDVPAESHVDARFEMPADTLAVYDALANTGVLTLPGRDPIPVDDDRVRLGMLHQLGNGFVMVNGGVIQLDTARVEFVRDLIGEDDLPTMVCVRYRHDLAMLRRWFPQLAALSGETPQADRADIIERWNTNRIPLLVISPQAAAHGLNLQHSECRRQIWMTNGWSHELYTQAVHRLVRTGQTRPITVIRTCAHRSLDDVILKALAGKRLNEADLLDRVRLMRKTP